jgi:hypothetical protein
MHDVKYIEAKGGFGMTVRTVVFGATGMVGGGVLHETLNSNKYEKNVLECEDIARLGNGRIEPVP